LHYDSIGDRVFISREPSFREDPDNTWLDEFKEIIGLHGTVLKDVFPYALDSIYARVEIDGYSDFYLPIPVLVSLND